jgi:DNA modification methylase
MATLYVGDSLAFLKRHTEFRNDIIFADPPYALGSELRVRPDGRVDYAKASDFMGKWEMPTGDWWEAWFHEAFRSLKHGGYCVLYGMDRQTLLFKYYAALAGFQERQSLYWYMISGFPKSSGLDLNFLKLIEAEAKKQFGIDIEWE